MHCLLSLLLTYCCSKVGQSCDPHRGSQGMEGLKKLLTGILHFGKRKKGDDVFLSKQNGETRDICRWKRDSFSSEVEITREIVWIKILKKRVLKKI